MSRLTNTYFTSDQHLGHAKVLEFDKRPFLDVQHIDGNPLNNCKSNLRLCNNSTNIQNTPARSDNKCGYKGVRFNKRRNKFTAQIGYRRRCIYIDSFDTVQEAARAYDNVAKKYYGSLAKTNFK